MSICEKEYGNKMEAGIGCTPTRKCPYLAVIPSIEVETTSELVGLSNTFVHVSENNTTYYIDDKFRVIIVWSGDVEVDDYDYENNPSGFKSQRVVDFENNRIITYDKTGEKYIVTEGVTNG